MQQGLFEVVSNRPLTSSVREMTLRGDVSAIAAPGQFLQIALDGFFLRRPISVCDLGKDTATIVYKTVGRGTEYLASLAGGARLDVLTGRGNGYDIAKSGDAPLLIGGGAGVPPGGRSGQQALSHAAGNQRPGSGVRGPHPQGSRL